jgi:hypothetical protein
LGLIVVTVEDAELPDARTRFGTVAGTAETEAWVVAPVDGRLSVPPIGFASTVDAGTVLTTVSPALSGGDVAGAAGLADEVAGARSDAERTEAAAQRARKLAPGGFVSAAGLEEAESGAASARARLAALERARRAWTTGEGGAISLRAPIPGAVAGLPAASGVAVRAGDVVARIVGPGARWIELCVPPDDPTGTSYEVVTAEGAVPAEWVGTGPAVEADGCRHDRLRVDVPLLPGSSVTVRVAVGDSRGAVVPETAIARAAGGDLVFVEAAPDRYRARPVVVAARFGGKARIEGVRPGEVVVGVGAISLLGEALRGQLGETE